MNYVIVWIGLKSFFSLILVHRSKRCLTEKIKADQLGSQRAAIIFRWTNHKLTDWDLHATAKNAPWDWTQSALVWLFLSSFNHFLSLLLSFICSTPFRCWQKSQWVNCPTLWLLYSFLFLRLQNRNDSVSLITFWCPFRQIVNAFLIPCHQTGTWRLNFCTTFVLFSSFSVNCDI